MRHALFVTSILSVGAIPLISAEAAPRLILGHVASVGGSPALMVRDGSRETARQEERRTDRREDRREDRGEDRLEDRHGGNHSMNGMSGIMKVREASEAPRGKDGPHDRNRNRNQGGHSSN